MKITSAPKCLSFLLQNMTRCLSVPKTSNEENFFLVCVTNNLFIAKPLYEPIQSLYKRPKRVVLYRNSIFIETYSPESSSRLSVSWSRYKWYIKENHIKDRYLEHFMWNCLSSVCYKTSLIIIYQLDQILAWCCLATSPDLSQCWPRYMMPNGVT